MLYLSHTWLSRPNILRFWQTQLLPLFLCRPVTAFIRLMKRRLEIVVSSTQLLCRFFFLGGLDQKMSCANQTAIPVLALKGDFGMDRSRERPLCCSAETTGAAAEARGLVKC